MFIQVRLLKGFSEPLLYSVPEELRLHIQTGSFVQVPVRNKICSAMVEKIINQIPLKKFIIKPLKALEPFPDDKYYAAYIQQLAHYYQIEPLHLIKRIRQFLLKKEATEDEHILVQHPVCNKKEIILTSEQENVCNFLEPIIQQPKFTPTVLHGVTGSGKTEVYKRLIIKALEEHKTVILLLPEVTLAVRFTQIFQQQLDANNHILTFHSASSAKEKKILWQTILAKKPCLIIGVHLPILLPIANLGLIIIDEEHESGYQEKKHPKINSKEAALLRAQCAQIPILLGSATPSMTTLYNVKEKGWHFFQLKKRFSGAFPEMKLLYLTEKKKKKQSFWISKELQEAIVGRLAKKEQTILFLNRRGYSFFVQCKCCSFIFCCNQCSVSLTLHDDRRLTCHYCGFAMQQPTQCFSCKAPEKELLKKGIGTQQLVAVLQQMFPLARIARADLDATINKKIWQQTMLDFQQGSIDILVGTQTITKGYHFPKVTLVGIIWADLAVHFPMYNATETALQQLIQVAGRAGRVSEESLVVVQTMVEHPLFTYLNEIDYLSFYEQELEHRKELHYPPLLRLVELELKQSDEQSIEYEAALLAQQLQQIIVEHQWAIQLLGPAKPPVHKIKNWHSRKIYLKSTNIFLLQALFQKIDKAEFQSTIFFTPNPLT